MRRTLEALNNVRETRSWQALRFAHFTDAIRDSMAYTYRTDQRCIFVVHTSKEVLFTELHDDIALYHVF